MAKTPRYRLQFDRIYSNSSLEIRRLFDDANTREQTGELYLAWEDCEAQRKRYQAGQLGRRRTKKIGPQELDIEAEARASVNKELGDFLWFCDFMVGALEYRSKQLEGSK